MFLYITLIEISYKLYTIFTLRIHMKSHRVFLRLSDILFNFLFFDDIIILSYIFVYIKLSTLLSITISLSYFILLSFPQLPAASISLPLPISHHPSFSPLPLSLPPSPPPSLPLSLPLSLFLSFSLSHTITSVYLYILQNKLIECVLH